VGHLGLAFTQGLPWCCRRADHPGAVGLAYVGGYLGIPRGDNVDDRRLGLQQKGLWKMMPLVVVWDATAF